VPRADSPAACANPEAFLLRSTERVYAGQLCRPSRRGGCVPAAREAPCLCRRTIESFAVRLILLRHRRTGDDPRGQFLFVAESAAQIALSLNVQPKSGTLSKVSAQPDRHWRGD